MNGRAIHLTGEQLSVKTHQKEISLANLANKSNQLLAIVSACQGSLSQSRRQHAFSLDIDLVEVASTPLNYAGKEKRRVQTSMSLTKVFSWNCQDAVSRMVGPGVCRVC